MNIKSDGKSHLYYFLASFILVASVCPDLAQPALNIAPAGNQSILYWPVMPGNYVLQSTTNLAAPNWVNLANAVQVNAFTVTNTSMATFFRLSYSAQNISTQYLAGIGVWLNVQQMLQENPLIADGSTITVSNLCGPLSIINNANDSASVEFSSTGANGLPGLLFPIGGDAELEITNAFVGVTSFTIAITFLDFNGTNNEINFLVQAGGDVDWPSHNSGWSKHPPINGSYISNLPS
jgi:hypothetical protein